MIYADFFNYFADVGALAIIFTCCCDSLSWVNLNTDTKGTECYESTEILFLSEVFGSWYQKLHFF
jgi:hypothetical protein